MEMPKINNPNRKKELLIMVFNYGGQIWARDCMGWPQGQSGIADKDRYGYGLEVALICQQQLRQKPY